MNESKVPAWLDGIDGDAARELILSTAPVIRVVAGPGSGKTTCLKRRTQRLVEGDGIDPKKIFVGTFTRAVTKELQEALGTEVKVSTLHSYARSLLQKHKAARQGLNLRFLLDFEQDALLYDIAEEGSFSPLGDIYKLREALRDVQSSRAKRGNYENAAFAGAVNRWLRRYRTMLIGEVVYLCVNGMESEDIPSGSFDHVVIDEYQDLTAAEQELVNFMWSRNGSLTVLGDDDQSIYGFRFNHPNGITDFHKSWLEQECKNISFSDNRRCGDQILHTANLMMAEAGSSKCPMRAKSGREGNQNFVFWDTIRDETIGLADFIRSKPDESFLVLVTRRFIGYLLAEAVGDEARTAFREEILQHQIAQEVFTAASLVANSEDLVTTRVWLGLHGKKHEQASRRNAIAYSNLPPGIGGKELLDQIAGGDIELSGDGMGNIKERAERAVRLLGRGLDAKAAIDLLFDPALSRFEKSAENRRWLSNNLSELRYAASLLLAQQASPDLGKVLDTLRYRIATRAPLLPDQKDPRVRIMTLHSAKGLEADNVIVAGVADQLMPGLETDLEDISEQRRLLYVAVTRARNSLLVSWPKRISYNHLKRNGGRTENEEVFRSRGELWVKTSQSSLLPQGLTGKIHGNKWLSQSN